MSSYTREDIMFDSHGTACAAWLYRPTGVENPPIVVMAHGFAAIRALRLDAYAARFAERDTPCWSSTTAVGATARASRGGCWTSVPSSRTGVPASPTPAASRESTPAESCCGAPRSVAVTRCTWPPKDHDVAAVIAQVPHISGPASAFSQPKRLVARLIAAGICATSSVRSSAASPTGSPLPASPANVAMMTSPDAAPMAIRLAGDRYEELLPENNVAARIALRVPFYSPGRLAHKITAPTLVQIAERDTVTPFEVAIKAAKKLAKGEIRTYDCQHFEPYLEPYFDTVIADQLAFLTTHVPAAT